MQAAVLRPSANLLPSDLPAHRREAFAIADRRRLNARQVCLSELFDRSFPPGMSFKDIAWTVWRSRHVNLGRGACRTVGWHR